MQELEQRAEPGWVERGLGIAAPVVALLGAGAWFQPSVAGSDLWWHLASGREIWRTGSIPHVDSFSYTFAGRPWTNHEWLWDVLYWGLYRTHPDAVAWFNLALLFAIFALAFEVARRASGSRLGAVLAVWLAAASAHWFLDIRPHLFTLLFVGIVLLFRDRSWAVWLWPLLMLVWVNLHGGFVFGLGTIGLIVLFRTAQPSLKQRRLVVPVREWLSVAACMLAMLCNPYGIEILAYPIAYLDRDSPFRSIIEWLPPQFSLDPERFEGRFWWMAALVAAGYWRALRQQPFLAALVAVSFAMAATSRRFIPLFAVTCAPVMALAIGGFGALARQRIAALRHGALGPALAIAGLVCALFWWQQVRLAPRLLDRWTEHWFYPEAALAYLQVLQPSERLFNYYNWGGYMFLHAPGVRAFIDGRANTLYDEQIYTDYIRILRGGSSYRAVLARYRIELVFAPTNSGLVQQLVRPPNAWTPIYMDRLATIAVPPDSALLTRPLPPHPLEGTGQPELEFNKVKQLAHGGRFDEAILKLESIIARDPLIPIVYGELAMLHAQRGDLPALRAAIERGIEASPREKARLHEMESRAYEIAGHLDEALAAARKSVPNGPFSIPRGAIERISSLENRRRAAAEPGG